MSSIVVLSSGSGILARRGIKNSNKGTTESPGKLLAHETYWRESSVVGEWNGKSIRWTSILMRLSEGEVRKSLGWQRIDPNSVTYEQRKFPGSLRTRQTRIER